jgi:L-lactate dehydrogenase complex protein LldG
MGAPKMSGKDGIIARIRASNRRAGPVPPEQAARNAERIAAHRPNLIPARAEGDAKTLADRFVAYAEEVAATVERVASVEDVPAAVARFLAQHNLPTELVASPSKDLDIYPWDRSLLHLERRNARPDDVVSVTPTVLGIAETGSMMVRSSAATPQTLHFMPPNHIAILRAADIVGSYETAWNVLRARMKDAGEEFPPRTVTLITGPSRTSDIEKTSYVGIHGPHRLHIVLVDGQDG